MKFFYFAWVALLVLGLGLLRTNLFVGVFILYWTNFLVFPALFLALGSARYLFGKKLRVFEWLLFPLSLAALCVFVEATLREPYQLEVETVTLTTDKLQKPLRILHISDLQPGQIGDYETRAFEMMRAAEPDLILCTGDLIQSYAYADPVEEQAKLVRLFQKLHPRYGILSVLGDVDHRLQPEGFGALAGLQFLQDQAVQIPVDGGKLRLLGLRLMSSRMGRRDLVADWLAQDQGPSFNLVFGHAPDYLLDLTELPGIDLALAGHTHGGQIRIPGWGPLVILSRVPKDWAMGYHEVGQLRFNVSAGIGAEHAANLPSIRFNCPPRMTLFLVQPSSGASAPSTSPAGAPAPSAKTR